MLFFNRAIAFCHRKFASTTCRVTVLSRSAILPPVRGSFGRPTGPGRVRCRPSSIRSALEKRLAKAPDLPPQLAHC